jgi:hypothetical protein
LITSVNRSQQLFHGRRFGHGAVQREHDVVGVEVRAVVEGHALAQIEHPDGRVVAVRAPRWRAPADGTGHIALQKRLVNLMRQRMGRPSFCACGSSVRLSPCRAHFSVFASADGGAASTPPASAIIAAVVSNLNFINGSPSNGIGD